MPRIVSNAELLKRGARLKGGAELEAPVKTPEPVVDVPAPDPSPVVAASTMDIAPMAEAVDRMTETIGQAMQVLSDVLRTIVAHNEKPPVLPALEFMVNYNSDGRIESISTRRTESNTAKG